MLIVHASLDGDPWKVASISVHGMTLVLLYSFSTLHHSVRELDDDAIYLLIASSYTPFAW